jgi:hypothetical protein
MPARAAGLLVVASRHPTPPPRQRSISEAPDQSAADPTAADQTAADQIRRSATRQ